MKMKFNTILASKRRELAQSSSRAGVKSSSSDLYNRKWKQFRIFCLDETIQEGNGVMDPEKEEPGKGVVGKIIEFLHFKVAEEGCDAGEVVNIRIALASVYKRNFGRVGEWKVKEYGSNEGSPINSIMIN